eukprot:TRINITY_DN6648_c0_g4_i2.p1 TRINITY_DN6648_c0_g4~~TRINITY_DN6648_c0_g4_i2.p1  ORF type:complete len:154 (-),score=22.21 TRINITY_DN6648_c0_g4_i2:833-1294(-)
MGLQAGKKLVTGPKEAVSTVLRTVVDFVKDVSKFVRPPWRVSGPLSTPEYVDPTSYEEHYRPTSPGSIPVKPSIPNADPAHIYHISYYERETRWIPVDHKVQEVSPEDMRETARKAAEEAGLPPPPGQPYLPYMMSKLVPVTVADSAKSSYQK